MKNTTNIWKIAAAALILGICVVAYSLTAINSNDSVANASTSSTSDAPSSDAHKVVSDKECPHKGDFDKKHPHHNGDSDKECPHAKNDTVE